jgi:predicted kinase
VLVLVNGAPGVGKSALADRYARDHALALVIDIDELRVRLGQWETVDVSKAIARDLAVALARDHLARGYDVVVPQYVGRREFADRLRGVAADAGTRFMEVIVTADDDAVVERFRARRVELAAAGARHPEADLDDDEVAAAIRAAASALGGVAAAQGVPLLDATAGVEATYHALCGVIAAAGV